MLVFSLCFKPPFNNHVSGTFSQSHGMLKIFSLHYGINFSTIISFMYNIVFGLLTKYREQWLYNIHFSVVKISCVFSSLGSVQDKCIREWNINRSYQVLKMSRFWLCAVTILSMCSLSSKLTAFAFACLFLA